MVASSAALVDSMIALTLLLIALIYGFSLLYWPCIETFFKSLFNIKPDYWVEDDERSEFNISSKSMALKFFSISETRGTQLDKELKTKLSFKSLPSLSSKKRFAEAVKRVIQAMRDLRREESKLRDEMIADSFAAECDDFQTKKLEFQSNFSSSEEEGVKFPQKRLAQNTEESLLGKSLNKSRVSEKDRDTLKDQDFILKGKVPESTCVQGIALEGFETFPPKLESYNPLAFPSKGIDWIGYVLLFPINALSFFLFPDTLAPSTTQKIGTTASMLFLWSCGCGILVGEAGRELVRLNTKSNAVGYIVGLAVCSQ